MKKPLIDFTAYYVAALIIKARNIVAKMTNNPDYPTPDPALAGITALIDDLEKFIAPMREKRKELEKDIPKVLAILKEGNQKAKKIASVKMEEIREKIGIKI